MCKLSDVKGPIHSTNPQNDTLELQMRATDRVGSAKPLQILQRLRFIVNVCCSKGDKPTRSMIHSVLWILINTIRFQSNLTDFEISKIRFVQLKRWATSNRLPHYNNVTTACYIDTGHGRVHRTLHVGYLSHLLTIHGGIRWSLLERDILRQTWSMLTMLHSHLRAWHIVDIAKSKTILWKLSKNTTTRVSSESRENLLEYSEEVQVLRIRPHLLET